MGFSTASLGLAGMTITLLQLTRSELEMLAVSRVPVGLAWRAERDSLPPSFVAARSLQLAKQGQPEPWSTSFLIVREHDNRIVGGCGFKTAPNNGRVEIGYGVAPSAQGMGAASAAVKLLLGKAFAAGATEVLAEVSAANHASIRVVQKAGFYQAGSHPDDSGEVLIEWIKRNDERPGR
jgi:[ribosomal protein S5]-alanine N-acetyltransferase